MRSRDRIRVPIGVPLYHFRGASAGCGPARCTKCNSPPINGQCIQLHIIGCSTIITSDKGRGMFLNVFVCLSVTKITEKRVHGFG